MPLVMEPMTAAWFSVDSEKSASTVARVNPAARPFR